MLSREVALWTSKTCFRLVGSVATRKTLWSLVHFLSHLIRKAIQKAAGSHSQAQARSR